MPHDTAGADCGYHARAMRYLLVSALVAALAGCGSTGPSANERFASQLTRQKKTPADLADELISYTAAHDDRGLAHMLGLPLGFGGVWFPDAQCRREFGGAGQITEARIDLFAKCLSAVPLVRAPQQHTYPEVVVFTYAPGILIEALLDPDDGGHVRWLGYAGRRDKRDALPTLTQEALLAQRHEVASMVLDTATEAEVARELGQARQPPDRYVWFKICVDAAGAVTSANPRGTSSIALEAAYAAWIKTWTFAPFVLGGQPSPVCGLVMFGGDGPIPNAELPQFGMPPPVPEQEAAAHVVDAAVLGDRLGGDARLAPDEAEQAYIAEHALAPVDGIVFYCLDEDGRVDRARLMRSTGMASYDKRLVEGVQSWRFAPYVVHGQPQRVCSFTHWMFGQR
jgi:TonB family protein